MGLYPSVDKNSRSYLLWVDKNSRSYLWVKINQQDELVEKPPAAATEVSYPVAFVPFGFSVHSLVSTSTYFVQYRPPYKNNCLNVFILNVFYKHYLFGIRHNLLEKLVDLSSIGPSNSKIRNDIQIAFAKTKERGNAVDLALGFESGVEFKGLVDVDFVAGHGIGAMAEPLCNERLDFLTGPAPLGTEFEHDVPGIG